jgi:hypothetical protein
MTGYLQRLAASVARPSPRLHPLVGSIFSGARQEIASPDLLQNDALTSADDQNLVSPTRNIAEPTEDPMRRRDLTAGDRIEPRTEIALPMDDGRIGRRRSEPEHPLMPSKGLEVAVSAMLSETVPGEVAGVQSPPQHDRRDTSIVDAPWVAPAAVEDGRAADRRNAAAPSPVSTVSERAGVLAVVAGDAAKPARAEFSAPARRSAQSEDIQIHIGRIEVTAVAQPAPRPAVAPVRKAMSLDEYLGRRSRGVS